MDRLRRPLFIAAGVLIVLVLLVELGAGSIVAKSQSDAGRFRTMIQSQLAGESSLSASDKAALAEQLTSQGAKTAPPGEGIPYLALLDGLIVFALAVMLASLAVPERVHGKVQGVVTLVVSLLLLIGAIVLIIKTFILLMIKLALFTAAPFGTIAYLAIWGMFNRGGAVAALSLIMALKLAFVVCLVLAHQRFLQNKGLVLIILTSLVAAVITSFLHGLVPLFLVSITDSIAAIISAILAAVWAFFLLIGAVVSVIKAIF